MSASETPLATASAAVPAPAPGTPPPITFTRASRWYGPVIALNDVTVSIPAGVVGLLGPNGAGKSTFLKLAAGQLRPSQGEVRLLGRPAWGSPEVFHRVGLCPETDAFWEQLTGLQFVTTLLRFTGYDEAECRHRAENALHQVELLDAKDRKIGGYSKGMRQRVKLAQAIAHEPEVLLLDEPVSGMDPVNRRRTIDLVRKLGREGKTVVVSSHILYEVEAMTRRVLLVHNGRILAEGDVREIRDLLDEHPHTVALRARDPRRLAAAIVPALDEEEALPRVLADLRAQPLPLRQNSSSPTTARPDRTADVAAGRRSPRCDRAAARLRRGMSEGARPHRPPRQPRPGSPPPDIVVFLDGDGADHPRRCGWSSRPRRGGSGARDRLAGARAERSARSLQRRRSSPREATSLIRAMLLLQRATDLGPFRAIRCPGAAAGSACATADYGWTVEMQVKAARRGLRVVEVPVGYRPRLGRRR